ncbi:MAG TPA: response regulator [Gemmatimonadaceae bacterium]|nr:response regulator [Gemmatimonadaceae bacterium]
MIRKPVLLVVDDEPGMLTLIERFAAPAGFDVHTNASASDAIATIAELAPDVAIVDLRTPEVGGLDVLRAIREAQPECRVILMTAHAEVESAIEAVKLGAMDYLSKPLDFDGSGSCCAASTTT